MSIYTRNITEIAAAIAAVGGGLASWRSFLLGKRVQEIHVLVNSQLSEVMARLAEVTAERDLLAPERAGTDPIVEIPPDKGKETHVDSP